VEAVGEVRREREGCFWGVGVGAIAGQCPTGQGGLFLGGLAALYGVRCLDGQW